MKRALRKRLSSDDAGFSLVDIVVGLAVMSVLMVVIMGGVAEIYSDVTRTENTSFAREQAGTGFRRLDKELRYATWISTPGKVDSIWYLEYSVPATPIPGTTSMTTDNCRQLKYDLDKRALSLAKWDPAGGGQPGKQGTIATDLTLVGGAPPFTLIVPKSSIYGSIDSGAAGLGQDFSPDYYQVRVQFNATFGKVSLPLDVVFTAQNTSGISSTSSDCSNGRPE